MSKNQIMKTLRGNGVKVHKKFCRLVSFTHPVHFCECFVLPAALAVRGEVMMG